MALHNYPNRVLLAAILSSLLVLGLCGTVGVFLSWEQSRTADVLEENIGSRQAAAHLEDDLAALAVLHHEGTKDVTPLHEKAEVHLADIERFADKTQGRYSSSGSRTATSNTDLSGKRHQPGRDRSWNWSAIFRKRACRRASISKNSTWPRSTSRSASTGRL